jgi:hypothetical protein
MKRQRDPYFLLILDEKQQADACTKCVLAECNISSAKCLLRKANAKAKASIVHYKTRAKRDRKAKRGYWPEIHGKV